MRWSKTKTTLRYGNHTEDLSRGHRLRESRSGCLLEVCRGLAASHRWARLFHCAPANVWAVQLLQEGGRRQPRSHSGTWVSWSEGRKNLESVNAQNISKSSCIEHEKSPVQALFLYFRKEHITIRGQSILKNGRLVQWELTFKQCIDNSDLLEKRKNGPGFRAMHNACITLESVETWWTKKSRPVMGAQKGTNFV